MSSHADEPESGPLDGLGHNAGEALANFSNAELLRAVDVMLIELERRLARYARVGPELLDMADEGLILAVRAGARLAQAQSAAQHAQGHLQVVGVGEWAPKSTHPAWNDDHRVTGDDR